MKLSKKTLQELKDNTISIEDLDDLYFIESYKVEVENILKLLNESICSFQKIVDKYKGIIELDSLLKNNKLFEESIQNNSLNKDDLEYLLNRIDKTSELYALRENTSLLKYIVDKDILSFKELVDKFKSVGELDILLENKKFFEELIQNNKLNTNDLKYLLSTIDKWYELHRLCEYNTTLIKHILNEFLLDKKAVDRFKTMIENDDWCEDRNIHTIFDWIEYENKNNEELLKLIELNKKVYLLNSFDLTKNQRLELTELIQNTEQAQNTLIQIIENNLEDQYDFESLKRILIKDTEKNLKTRFNF